MPVQVRVRLRGTRFNVVRLRRLAEQVLAGAGGSGSELSLELIGDGRMRRLNHEYREVDRTTDVLAFPMQEAAVPRWARQKPELLGDVVISVPTALRQARDAGRSLGDELTMLLVHGVLHLCGYDHERSKKEAARMHRRERAILQRIGSVPRLVTSHTKRREGTR